MLRRLDFRVINDVICIVLGSIGVRSHGTNSTSTSSDLFDHVRLVRSIAIWIQCLIHTSAVLRVAQSTAPFHFRVLKALFAIAYLHVALYAPVAFCALYLGSEHMVVKLGTALDLLAVRSPIVQSIR